MTPPGNSQGTSTSPITILLNPAQLSQGNAWLVMHNPVYVDIHYNEIQFDNLATNDITFIIYAQPNTSYLLDIKVDAVWSNPQFTIYTGQPNIGEKTNAETFTGVMGLNEFAYGIVSNSAGYIEATIYSASSPWSFINCEITSAVF